MTLKFVGDIKIDSPLKGRISSEVVHLLNTNTRVVANLEAPLTNCKIPSPKWASLKQSPDRVADLKYLNVRAVSLANNHMFDFGHDGLMDTIRHLERGEILHFGAGKNLDASLEPAKISLDSETLHLYSLTTTLPLESGASVGRAGVGPIKVRCVYYFDPVGLQEGPGRPPMVYCQYDKSDMKKVINRIKNDVKEGIKPVVSMHWGMAYQRNLTDYQVEIGHKMVEAGAEMIIGHHPHVLQEIEIYKGKMIFHSLGNFLWEGKGIRQNKGKWNSWPPQYGVWNMSPNTMIVDTSFRNGEISAKLIPIILKSGMPAIPTEDEKVNILSEISIKGGLAEKNEFESLSVISA